MSRLDNLFASRRWLLLLAIYLAALAAYLPASGNRLRRASPYNHFAYLAETWLQGHLAMPMSPPNENDWALVEELTLRDGRTVKGTFSKTGATDRFLPLKGKPETITNEEIASRRQIRYVSFPPFPAVVFTPFVAIFHLQFNDVLFNVLWGAANPVLLFLLLRELARRGHSRRSAEEDLWLTAAFAVGSVYYYSTVVGQVWYTAHVIGVSLVIGYAWASLDAHRPALAGLFLGLGFATRTPAGFMFPFFLFEAVRAAGGWERLWRDRRLPAGLFAKLLRFAIPAAAVLAVLLVHNHLRFERPTEFGHKYLNIGWAERIQRWGLFNYHFLSRNLACALVLLPRILAKAPYVQVSVHGMSMLVTSPWLVWVARARAASPLAPGLWLTVLATAAISLLYQNSGYYQFGYRFSLDYIVFLLMLLAIGGRPLTKLWKALVVFAFAVNLFGALTFDRHMQHTYDDTFFPHGNN